MRARVPRISRLGVAVAVLSTAALLAGCATGPTSTASADSTLTYAIEGANLSSGKMDIHSSQLDVTALVMRNAFDSLIAQGADGTFVPWLAKSWEISEDGLHYTFQLRDDVKFQDGEPFNAAAVKANFDHVVAPKTASAQAASAIGYAETDGHYLDTEVVDKFTVRVNFRQPYAPFLQAVSTAQLGFYAPNVLKEKVDQLGAGGPGISVGTGPYILTEYTPDQKLVFTANPDYNWPPANAKHAGPSSIRTLVIRILPESSVRTGALTSGEAQVASDITPSSVSQIGDNFTIKTVELPGLPYSLYLNEKHGVFADQKVREAFELGFDVDSAVKSIFFGQYARAWSILGPTTPNSYDASLEGSWPFDQAKANALLDAAGWTARDADGYREKDGKRLSARWIAYTPVPEDSASLADIVQSNLKEIGFEVVRDVLEPAQYNEAYGPRDFDFTDWSFSSPDADVLRSHLHTGGFQTVSQISKPQIDDWLDEAVATSDPAAREALYKKIQKWNNDQVLIVPLYVPSAITASSKTVSGVSFDLYGRPLFYGASISLGG